MPEGELITVGNYSRIDEAEFAQGILETAGIESVLLDDNVGRMLPWLVVGGFRLQVNSDDADAATQLLVVDEPALDGPAPRDGAGQGSPAACPNCDSADIVLQPGDAHAGSTENSFLPPSEAAEKFWQCKSCGYTWDAQPCT